METVYYIKNKFVCSFVDCPVPNVGDQVILDNIKTRLKVKEIVWQPALLKVQIYLA